MPEQVLAAVAAAAPDPIEAQERVREFLTIPERLHLHDPRVSPVLRYIARFAGEGLRDPHWYEEQLVFLLERLFRAHEQAIGNVRPQSEPRAAVRAELLRRIARARDFILSNYDQKLTLTHMAEVAHLSRYHFARLFRDVQGVSPSEFLRRKRISVAIRLLRTTRLTVEGVAHRCGLADRSTLYRLCVEHRGQTPRRLRTDPGRRAAVEELTAP
jgi:AraC-like DNA-binding protein